MKLPSFIILLTAISLQVSAADRVHVTTSQLFEEYEENELAADEKFNGKEFEITGVVENVGRDILGHPYVFLEGQGESVFGLGVQCFLNHETRGPAAKLRAGQTVTLIGKGDGKMGNILMKSCRIKKVD